MSAHPPGHPPASPPTPTGPGRSLTPGPDDAALRPSDGPGINPIAECAPRRRPRLGEVIRDLECLFQRGLNILELPIDRDSYPDGPRGYITEARFEVVGFQLRAALCELAEIAALNPPPVGSAVPFVRRPA